MAFQGYLKEDTATTFRLGPFVDKTDGVTYEVGMAAAMNHGTTGVRISKNGGALAARTTATEPVYDAFGYYLVNLDATDVGTVGRLKTIFGDAAVCLPCEADFEILPANVFDALMGTDLLDVSTVQIAGTAQTAGDIVAAIITNAAGADIAADIIALKVVADAIDGRIPAALTGDGNIKADALKVNGAAPTTLAAAVTAIAAGVVVVSGIPKNTALAKFSFVMRDSTNHLPLAGLAPTCTRSIDGGAFGAGALANIAGVSNGVYVLDFGAGDLNGKVITLRALSAGADDTFITIITQG
jgi:hypothetical protein